MADIIHLTCEPLALVAFFGMLYYGCAAIPDAKAGWCVVWFFVFGLGSFI